MEIKKDDVLVALFGKEKKEVRIVRVIDNMHFGCVLLSDNTFHAIHRDRFIQSDFTAPTKPSVGQSTHKKKDSFTVDMSYFIYEPDEDQEGGGGQGEEEDDSEEGDEESEGQGKGEGSEPGDGESESQEGDSEDSENGDSEGEQEGQGDEERDNDAESEKVDPGKESDKPGGNGNNVAGKAFSRLGDNSVEKIKAGKKTRF